MASKSNRKTYILGLIPLIGGLSIFFAWWIEKAVYVTNNHKLEMWGMYWIFISIPVGLVGLFASIDYFYKNEMKNRYHGVLGLLCVLINIPVLIWILNKQDQIERQAYVKIYNQTDLNIKQLMLKRIDFVFAFDALEKGRSKITHFSPTYDNDFQSEPSTIVTTLTIETDKIKRTIEIPDIYGGDCTHVYIDNSFNVTTKNSWR